MWKLPYFTEKTLVKKIQNKAKQTPEKLAVMAIDALLEQDVSITYAELDAKAKIIAHYLLSRRLANKTVLLLFSAGIDFALAFIGCLYAGVIAVPVSGQTFNDAEKENIKAIAEDAKTAAVLTVRQYADVVNTLLQNTLPDNSVIDLNAVINDNIKTELLPAIKLANIAYLQYTSGSISTPKGVIITHLNLLHNLKRAAKIWRYRKRSITLTWAPLTHIYGMTCGLLLPLYSGSLAILMPLSAFIASPVKWLKAITKYNATHSGCPNFGYEMCVKDITEDQISAINLHSWKVAVNGGELLQAETLYQFDQKFNQYGFQPENFCSAYGMSELTGLIAATSYLKKPTILQLNEQKLQEGKIVETTQEAFSRKIISSGFLLPKLTVKIVDPETLLPVAAETIGEICLAGPSVTAGYWQRQEETQQLFQFTLNNDKSYYFRTGDLGFIKKGEIYLVGRLKELIIVNGKKIYASEIETIARKAISQLINYRPGIAAFAIVKENKEEVIVVLEIKPEELNLTSKIIAAICSAIKHYCGIDIADLLLIPYGQLPKTNSGKVQRSVCRQCYADKQFKVIASDDEKNSGQITLAAAKSLLAEEIQIKIQKCFSDDLVKILSELLNLEVNAINLMNPVSDYGFNSINIIKLAGRLNEIYQLDLSPALLYEYKNLYKFAEDVLKNHFEKLKLHYLSQLSLDAAIAKSSDYENKITVKSMPKTVEDYHSAKQDIAVIGLNGVFPGAADIENFWENLCNGRSSITEIPAQKWNWQAYYGEAEKNVNKTKVKWGGFIEDMAAFDADFFNISPREAELMDPQHRIFLQVVWRTIEDAGYTPELLNKSKVGVFVGVTTNDYTEILQKNNITEAHTITGVTNAMLANRISYLLNFHGPSQSIDTACSSSLVAVHQAIQAILCGDCAVAIAGGVNALLTPNWFIALNKAGVLSEDGVCRTFDQAANGYVRGEGAAAILLKPLKNALADGDHIYGVIKSTAVNHGGNVSSLTVPNPLAQTEVLMDAYKKAELSIETINYIEVHGSGTVLGDPIEINALKKAFFHSGNSDQKSSFTAPYCGLGTVKPNIGHLEAAAGIASVIKVLLAIKNARLPPTVNFNTLNPLIELKDSPFYIVDKLQTWQQLHDNAGNIIPRRAGISSFGLGGTNSHIIIEENSLEKIKAFNEQPIYYLITVSAKNDQAFKQRITDLYQWLVKANDHCDLQAISYTLNRGRSHFIKRCAIIVNSISELHEALLKIKQNQFSANVFSSDMVNTRREDINNHPSIEAILRTFKDTFSKSTPEYKNALLDLGRYYADGNNLDWEAFYADSDNVRISLPAYPFAKVNYWVVGSEKQPDASHLTQPDNRAEEKPMTAKSAPHASNNNYSRIKIEEIIRNSIADILKIKPDKITHALSFTELGFDSITLKEFSIQLAANLQLELNPALFFAYTTITTLADYIAGFMQEPLTTAQPAVAVDDQPIEVMAEAQTTMASSLSVKSDDAVAIIGMHGLFPQSNNLNILWEHLLASHDLVSEVPVDRWDWSEYYSAEQYTVGKTNSKWGGFLNAIDKFDAEFFNISPSEAIAMDPQHRLFLETAWHTIEDAGYDPEKLSGENAGVFMGLQFNEYQDRYIEEPHPYTVTGNCHALLSNRFSYLLNLKGPSEVILTACSSSLVAIHRAVTALRNNECNLAIAGGVSLIIDPKTYVATSQLGMLSADGRCKTFDKAANGYVKGEGVAALLLKPLIQAQKDGDHIYGVIKGTAVNHGGKAQSLTAPNMLAQSELITKAYEQANVAIDTITYIETHGTGTELGDPIEIEGLKQAFNKLAAKNNKATDYAKHCGLGSIKTNIGHLEPAAGIAGVIKVLLSMRHKKIPGNLHFKELNPFINIDDSPFYIITKTQDWPRLKDNAQKEIPRRAGVSSFGFGGTNAHIVIEEARSALKPVSVKTSHYHLITLSAKNKESLTQKVADLYEWLLLNKHESLTDIAFTLNQGRAHYAHRYALVVASIEEFILSCKHILDGQPLQNFLRSVENNDLVNLYSPVVNKIYQTTLAAVKNDASQTAENYFENLMILADFYIKGYAIDWQLLYTVANNNRVAGMPVYPFSKKRYWYADNNNLQPTISSKNDTIATVNASKKITTTLIDLKSYTANYLRKIFSQALGLSDVNKISLTANYETYGVDSLQVLNIIKYLEEDFGNLPKTLLFERTCLRDLAAYFQQYHQATLQNLYNREHGVVPQQDLPETANTIDDKPAALINAKAETEQNKTQDKAVETAIAIIGLAGTYPAADDAAEFWRNLTMGRDCITEIPLERWNYKDYPVTVSGKAQYYNSGGFIPDIDKFDPLFFGISPRDAALMDPQERLFMQAAWHVIEDAGYTRAALAHQCEGKVGVFAGVTYNFYPLYIAEKWAEDKSVPLNFQQFPIANRLSYFLNINGPSYPVDTACSSSLAAIHLACQSIINGECIMAIAGGSNLSLHPAKYHMLGTYGLLSEQGRCTSFAANGTGYVPAEGVGAVLLKSLNKALEDKDYIYGVIKSTSINHGGKTSGFTVPNPNAQSALIKDALQKADINPRTITYIEAHGTGTALGDPIEVRGLQAAFEHYTNDKQFCAIGSVKSNIGHLEAAAGMSQLAKVLLQMKYKKIAPSLHAENLNPFIEFEQTPFYVQRTLTDWLPYDNNPRRAGISSFGAGGANVHIIVEEFIAETLTGKNSDNTQADKFIFLLSAFDQERLREYASKFYKFFLDEKSASREGELTEWLLNVCYSLQIGREAMAAKLVILAVDYHDLLTKLQNYIAQPANEESGIWLNEALVKNIEETELAADELQSCINQKEYEKIIEWWLQGKDIDWSLLYLKEIRQRIPLPTYPFAKRRCWIQKETNRILSASATVAIENINEIKTVIKPAVQYQPTADDLKLMSDWLYKLTWQPQANSAVNTVQEEGVWLIFSDDELGSRLKAQLGKTECICCFMGNAYQRQSETSYIINPDNLSDYVLLLKELFVSNNKLFRGIIYLWPAVDQLQSVQLTDVKQLTQQQPSNKLFYLFNALLNYPWANNLTFCLVTRESQNVTGKELIQVWQHYLWALVRVFAMEQAKYQVLLLDLGAKNLQQDAENIVTEIRQRTLRDNHVAYRENERYVLRLKQYGEQAASSDQMIKSMPKTILITGGLGALGSETAQHLIKYGARQVLLIGSTRLPPVAEWSAIKDTSLKEKIDRLLTLQKLGAEIHYEAADVADKAAMQTAIAEVEKNWQTKITGVFHLAGVTTDSISLNKMSLSEFNEVLAVKVSGTLVLHELFATHPLENFVLFSSVAAMPCFAMSGLSAYATANAFLDGFAHYRNNLGLPALSINWIAWAEKGMGHQYNHAAFLNAVGMTALPIKQGMTILNYLLCTKLANICVFKTQWDKFFQASPDAKRLPLLAEFANKLGITAHTAPVNIKRLTAAEIIAILKNTLADALAMQIDEFNVEVPYQTYGVDSIVGIDFIGKLAKDFPDLLTVTDLFRFPSIKQLAEYIEQSLQEVLRADNNSEVAAQVMSNEKDWQESALLKEITSLDETTLASLLEKEIEWG